MSDLKRLFFAAHVTATWPSLPEGKILAEESRHCTLAFLGTTSLSELLEEPFPIPPFHLSPAGCCHKWKFLPSEKEIRVVAAEAEFFQPDLLAYQKLLESSLKSRGYLKKETRPFFPHITVARGTPDVEVWKKIPCKVPFFVSSVALMESLGNSHYKPIWEHPLIAPFDEIEHTADIAFQIRGNTFLELFLHAQLALAFKCPELIDYFSQDNPSSLDQVIASLNRLIGRADQEIGVPFKAVSYHDEISYHGNYREWKMIVDV